MNVHCGAKLCLVIALVALGTNVGLAKAARAQPRQADGEEGVQVLTRGPVHEAFAGTVTFNPEPGIVAPKAAPEAIEELPPEQKPEGANVAWIPGYWAWDDERNDFLWVSGIWRALPPGRQWVSGYWGKSAKGFQWTSGYWADAKASEVEYLPEPPETVEAGPNIAAPSVDHSWIPGCWMWHQRRYAWRPGYWATAQPDWAWVPSYYVWAPRGYVFVDGYWDYSVGRRGVLFAPVYFDAGIYARRGFRYSPTTAINLSVFTDHLFSRPRYQHYYFGDYYGAGYQTAGYYPSYSIQSRHHGYDPIYAHERWQHRQDRGWEQRVAAQFQHRRDHEDARPPRTWSAQSELGRNEARSREKSLLVATSFDELAKSTNSGIRFQRMDTVEWQNLVQRGQEVRKFREERQRVETQAAETRVQRPVRDAEPARVRLPRSPIAARPADQLDRGQAPPKNYVTPQPDPKVEPKPRQVGGRPVLPKKEPTVTKREPIADPPKAEARPERPKAAEPRPERPRTQPTPERPKAEPRPERPKAPPQPQVKRNEPKREPPQAQSKERPPRQSQEAPRGASQDKPNRQPQEAPRGESKEKPKK